MLEIVKIEEIFFSLTKIYIISVRWHNDEYRGGPVLRGYSGIQFALNVYNHKQKNVEPTESNVFILIFSN